MGFALAPLFDGFFAAAVDLVLVDLIALVALGALPALALVPFAGAAFFEGAGVLAFLVGFLDLGAGRFFEAIGPALYVGSARTRMPNLHVACWIVRLVGRMQLPVGGCQSPSMIGRTIFEGCAAS